MQEKNRELNNAQQQLGEKDQQIKQMKQMIERVSLFMA